MNDMKFNLTAEVYFQEEMVMSIALGNGFDTKEAAKEAAYKHIKTVDMEFDSEIVYEVLEITNYGTDDEDGKPVFSISYSVDEETCKDIITEEEVTNKILEE